MPPTADKTTATSRNTARNRVSDHLRSWISERALKEGDPLPSEAMLTRRLSVSRDTVRAAFQDLEAAGLVRASQGRVRRVARSERRVDPLLRKTVVLLSRVAEPDRFWHPGWDTHTQLVVARQLRDQGLHLLTIACDQLTDQDINHLATGSPFGLIVMPELETSPDIEKLIEQCRRCHVPVVVESNDPKFQTNDRVFADHIAGAQTLAHWLIKQGRRRILPLFPTHPDPWWVEDRLAGYRTAVESSGNTPLKPVLIPELIESQRVNQTHIDHMVRVLIGYLYAHVHCDEPIDAIMAMTDRQAAVIAVALQSMGKDVHQEIAVVGYDAVWPDVPEQSFCSLGPIATIDKNNTKIGEAVVELLIRRANQNNPEDEPQTIRIAPSIKLMNE